MNSLDRVLEQLSLGTSNPVVTFFVLMFIASVLIYWVERFIIAPGKRREWVRNESKKGKRLILSNVEVNAEAEGAMPEVIMGVYLRGTTQYEVIGFHEGGMGLVLISKGQGTTIAVKTFKKEFFFNKNVIKRFMQEARVWQSLEKHKNIVTAFSVKYIVEDPENGLFPEWTMPLVGGFKTPDSRRYVVRPAIVLEYVNGGTLHNLIGRLSVLQSLDFAIQFCGGMEYAWDKSKVIHRDIKPTNVLISRDGILKITDFGLAKALDCSIEEARSGKSGIPDNLFLTETGLVAGTPAYMSPEQFLDTKSVRVESDIYSFGVMLYEMLTGRLPFYANGLEGYMHKHLHETPRSASELNYKIPTKLDFIVMKCLNKNLSDRYHSFGEMKALLKDI